MKGKRNPMKGRNKEIVGKSPMVILAQKKNFKEHDDKTPRLLLAHILINPLNFSYSHSIYLVFYDYDNVIPRIFKKDVPNFPKLSIK